MPTTSRMTIPYPSENQDPYYDAFLGLMNALDASLYASREDRHLVFMNGGTFGFTVDPITGIGTLSWTQPINIIGAITGHLWSIAAGSVVLANGAVAYVDLPRAPVQTTAIAMNAAMQVPSTDAGLLFGVHKGSIFYARNGRCIHDSEALLLLDSSTGSGGGGSSRVVKDPCLAATVGSVTLAGGAPSSVDGIGLAFQSRVLVRDQALPSENGIYVVATLGTGANGTWTRADDLAVTADFVDGAVCVVRAGNTYGDKMFELTVIEPVLVGTNPVAWGLLSGIGAPGQSLINTIPIVLNQSTTLTSLQAVGHYYVDPNAFVVTGTTASALFQAIGFVTGTAAGQVELYDLTASSSVHTFTFVAGTASPTNAITAVTLVTGAHMYEVRIKVSAGTGTFFCDWAGLQFRNTF